MGSWHCFAMCGPIAMMIPGSKGKNKIFSSLLYNSGKILAYVIIGALFGIFTVFVESFKVQAIISISVGTLIAFLAIAPSFINMAERKGYKVFDSFLKLKSKLAAALNKNRLEFGFYIGFLNGFIPCGMVYIAAMGAMVQPTYSHSLLYMLFFGLGTMPMMSTIIIASSLIKKKMGTNLKKVQFAGLLLVGLILVWQGIQQYSTEIDAGANDHIEVCG